MSVIWGYALVIGAGVSFVFQQAVNANLRADIGSPWWTGFVNYLGGTLAMLAVAVALQEPWPSMQAVGRSQWLSWTGGIFGTIYIAISIIQLPKLGAATVIALIIAGQMIGSLVFDHFGLMGVPIHQISLMRILGAIFLVIGVTFIRW